MGMLNSLLITGAGVLALGFSAWTSAPPEPAPAQPEPAPVFVELFTSEGCSSCPPADELVSELAKVYKDKPVHFAAFHVDYWDSIGWPDRFASASFTARQRAYASAYKARSVYTPQVIVGGTIEFVGSDRARAIKQIDLALARGPHAKLELTLTPPPKVDVQLPPDREVEVQAKVTWSRPRPQSPVRVLTLLVEDGLVSKVTRGENAGRTLTHDRVVRASSSTEWPGDDQLRLSIKPPKDIHRDKARVIVVVQEGSDQSPGPVLGSASLKLD
jgi:hypothetical protein